MKKKYLLPATCITVFLIMALIFIHTDFFVSQMEEDETISVNNTSSDDTLNLENREELSYGENDSPTDDELSDMKEENSSIEIVMIGDMLMHERVMESGKTEDGTYNFDHLFANVKSTIENADLALVNQETILGGSELSLSGYPNFNSPYELGDALVTAGFDVILHATNHTLDKGKTGVMNCMNFWDTNYPDIAYLGINHTQEEQDSDIYIYEQSGIKIAILNYTYGTNGIQPPSDMPFLVNYLEKEKVIMDLKYAEENADFTIVCPHWGSEYILTATDSQKYWAEIFMENGADLVIGTHPHVIEPIELLTDENGNEMLVYYSIGNFVNGTSGVGQGITNRIVGGIADVTISRDESGEVVINNYDIIPIVCHIAEKTDYTVYYLSDYTDELAKENQIISQDPDFSLESCNNLVHTVWYDFSLVN